MIYVLQLTSCSSPVLCSSWERQQCKSNARDSHLMVHLNSGVGSTHVQHVNPSQTSSAKPGQPATAHDISKGAGEVVCAHTVCVLLLILHHYVHDLTRLQLNNVVGCAGSVDERLLPLNIHCHLCHVAPTHKLSHAACAAEVLKRRGNAGRERGWGELHPCRKTRLAGPQSTHTR